MDREAEMSDDTDRKDKPKRPKRLVVATEHVGRKGEGDKDFETIKEARVAAAEDHALLSMRLRDLSDELKVATWDGEHKYKGLASMQSKHGTHDLIGAAGMLGGIGIMFASAGTGAVIGVASGLTAGNAQAKDLDVRRDLRRDYTGKQESEFQIDLGNGTVMHVPVTHRNTQELAAALEKARETVNPIDHAKRTPDEVMATVKSTIAEHMKGHAEGTTIEAAPTKITGGVDVKDHGAAPGGSKPPGGKGRGG